VGEREREREKSAADCKSFAVAFHSTMHSGTD
jgi:hypothetical protein